MTSKPQHPELISPRGAKWFAASITAMGLTCVSAMGLSYWVIADARSDADQATAQLAAARVQSSCRADLAAVEADKVGDLIAALGVWLSALGNAEDPTSAAAAFFAVNKELQAAQENRANEATLCPDRTDGGS